MTRQVRILHLARHDQARGRFSRAASARRPVNGLDAHGVASCDNIVTVPTSTLGQ
jgi:mRNA-degrading endonuclease toxin of MazEF toxin-antitoxin module